MMVLEGSPEMEISNVGTIRRGIALAKEGKGKVVDRGVKYRKVFIYIPTKVFEDSAFPFKIGEDVLVQINGDRLVISKLDKGEEKR